MRVMCRKAQRGYLVEERRLYTDGTHIYIYIESLTISRSSPCKGPKGFRAITARRS